jgi:hypothetical protein
MGDTLVKVGACSIIFRKTRAGFARIMNARLLKNMEHLKEIAMLASELLLRSAKPFDEACEKVLMMENDLDYVRHSIETIRSLIMNVDESFETRSVLQIVDSMKIMLSSPDGAHSPIETCLAQYMHEGDDFSDLEWVAQSALRQAHFMGDSQARCLLYVLANKVKEQV